MPLNNILIDVLIQRLPHAPKALPDYATPGSAGMDLQAAIDEPFILNPGERTLVPTGFILNIPQGYECQIRARSGLAIHHGVSLANGVGTIDSDYRHEVKVALVNLSSDPYTIQPGDRIAQLLLAPVSRIAWKESQEQGDFAIGERQGGFGSTGLNSGGLGLNSTGLSSGGLKSNGLGSVGVLNTVGSGILEPGLIGLGAVGQSYMLEE